MANAKRTKQKNDWQREHVDRINLTVRKGRKEEIQDHAKAQDESVISFINRAIDEAMERDGIIEQGREEVEALAKECSVDLEEQELKKLVVALAVLESKDPDIKRLYFNRCRPRDPEEGKMKKFVRKLPSNNC